MNIRENPENIYADIERLGGSVERLYGLPRDNYQSKCRCLIAAGILSPAQVIATASNTFREKLSANRVVHVEK